MLLKMCGVSQSALGLSWGLWPLPIGQISYSERRPVKHCNWPAEPGNIYSFIQGKTKESHGISKKKLHVGGAAGNS